VRRLIVGGALIASLLVVPATPAAAETTTSVSGDVITVHLEIDCVGCKGKTVIVPDPENPTETKTIGLAEKWELDALAAWGNAFENYKYCGKYRLELDLTINARGSRFKGTRNHRIKVDAPDGLGGATAGWDSGREENRSGPDGQRSPDGTRFYERNVVGSIPEDATSTVVAHEIGHPLGLGDDRDENGNVLPGRDGTLMVGGGNDYAGKNSPQSHLRIDQSLINRIGALADKVDPDVECKQTSWNGTLNGTGVNQGIPACPDPSAHNGTFTMTVKPDGTATLTGHIVNTSVCVGGFTTEADFALEGRRTRSAITFAPVPTFPFPVDLRIRGDRASGTSTANPGGDGIYIVTLDLTAECQNCDEAVG